MLVLFLTGVGDENELHSTFPNPSKNGQLPSPGVGTGYLLNVAMIEGFTPLPEDNYLYLRSSDPSERFELAPLRTGKLEHYKNCRSIL